MAVPCLKTLTNSLKLVEKSCCANLYRASCGSLRPTPLLGLKGPSTPIDFNGNLTRDLSTSAPLKQALIDHKINGSLLESLSSMQGKVECLSRRDFMKLSGITQSPGLPPVDTNGTFYFDTHRLVTTLQSHGFSLDQAETITECLTEILSNGAAGMSKYMVSRNELAQLEIRMSATVEALRKDMVILEKSEFLMLKQENENMKSELTQLSRLMRDELLKVRSGLTLDLSLEKGRAKEDASVYEQRIRDTNNRIETEIAKVKMEMEAQKLDLIKYLVGSFLSVVTVLIGWWRFVKS